MITDNSAMGMDPRTNGHVWQRGESSDEKRTLSGSSCLLLLSVCLFLSLALPLLLLFDGQFPDFRTGRTEMLASFLRVHVATRFISLHLSRLDKWSSPVEWRLSPSVDYIIYRGEMNNRRRGWAFKEAVTLKKKKSVITKINNQTNNQTTICSNFKDELLLGALCSFCDFWCHNVFLTLLVFFLFFLDLLLLWAS